MKSYNKIANGATLSSGKIEVEVINAVSLHKTLAKDKKVRYSSEKFCINTKLV